MRWFTETEKINGEEAVISKMTVKDLAPKIDEFIRHIENQIQGLEHSGSAP